MEHVQNQMKPAQRMGVNENDNLNENDLLFPESILRAIGATKNAYLPNHVYQQNLGSIFNQLNTIGHILGNKSTLGIQMLAFSDEYIPDCDFDKNSRKILSRNSK